jgi:hypothetical protein
MPLTKQLLRNSTTERLCSINVVLVIMELLLLGNDSDRINALSCMKFATHLQHLQSEALCKRREDEINRHVLFNSRRKRKRDQHDNAGEDSDKIPERPPAQDFENPLNTIRHLYVDKVVWKMRNESKCIRKGCPVDIKYSFYQVCETIFKPNEWTGTVRIKNSYFDDCTQCCGTSCVLFKECIVEENNDIFLVHLTQKQKDQHRKIERLSIPAKDANGFIWKGVILLEETDHFSAVFRIQDDECYKFNDMNKLQIRKIKSSELNWKKTVLVFFQKAK